MKRISLMTKNHSSSKLCDFMYIVLHLSSRFHSSKAPSCERQLLLRSHHHYHRHHHQPVCTASRLAPEMFVVRVQRPPSDSGALLVVSIQQAAAAVAAIERRHCCLATNDLSQIASLTTPTASFATLHPVYCFAPLIQSICYIQLLDLRNQPCFLADY